MVTHSVIVALLAAAPAATPAESSEHSSVTVVTETGTRTAPQLREAVHAALRRQATAKGTQQHSAVRELAAVYREVAASTALPPREKEKLRTLVRSRLVRTSNALKRQLAREQSAAEESADGQAEQVRVPAKRAILAQVQGNPAAGQPGFAGMQAPARGAGQGGAQFGPGGQIAGAAASWNAQTNQNAQQLIDLIQNTIAPSSWDVNGGPGTIMYYAPAQVLVIRQTGGIHGQVGQAIQRLRGN